MFVLLPLKPWLLHEVVNLGRVGKSPMAKIFLLETVLCNAVL